MKKEMLINVLQPEECRIAIVENGVLEELYVERTSHESYTGNIYKGKVVNLEPAIQAAFVDFSVGRNGFLHVSDVEPQYYSRHQAAGEAEPAGPGASVAPGPKSRDREPRRDREKFDRRPSRPDPLDDIFPPSLPPPSPRADDRFRDRDRDRDRDRERPDRSTRGRRDRSEMPRRFGEGLVEDRERAEAGSVPPASPPEHAAPTAPELHPADAEDPIDSEPEHWAEAVERDWEYERQRESRQDEASEEPRWKSSKSNDYVDPDLPPNRAQRGRYLAPPDDEETGDLDAPESFRRDEDYEPEGPPPPPRERSEREPRRSRSRSRDRDRDRSPGARPSSGFEAKASEFTEYEAASEEELSVEETSRPEADPRYAEPPRRRGGRAAIRSRGGEPGDRPRESTPAPRPKYTPEPERERPAEPPRRAAAELPEPPSPRERTKPHARAGEPGYIPRRERLRSADQGPIADVPPSPAYGWSDQPLDAEPDIESREFLEPSEESFGPSIESSPSRSEARDPKRRRRRRGRRRDRDRERPEAESTVQPEADEYGEEFEDAAPAPTYKKRPSRSRHVDDDLIAEEIDDLDLDLDEVDELDDLSIDDDHDELHHDEPVRNPEEEIDPELEMEIRKEIEEIEELEREMGLRGPVEARPRRGDEPSRPGGRTARGGGRGIVKPPIQEIFRRGDEVLVQVIKESIGTKGPTLSTYISIPGRYLVLMPGLNRVGVSRKIVDEGQRRKLREIMHELNPPKGLGFIVRTAGLERTKRELARDLAYLLRLWKVILRRIKRTRTPGPIYQESDMITRTIRDIFTSEIDTIWIDEPAAFERAQEFLRVVMPRFVNRIKLYDEKVPLFHKYGIEDEIAKIQRRHVPLPEGGSIVIDQTEALVAIDVNSGNFRVEDDAERTAYEMNLRAAKEIARQLRLRDLGGVIVNDFIDMREERHRRGVERALREAIKRDRARTKVLRMSAFGLIEMTRQRIRPSLKRSIYEDCPHCTGAGVVKTAESMAIDVIRLLALASHRDEIKRISVTVHSNVATYLNNRKRHEITRIESESNMVIQVSFKDNVPAEHLQIDCYDANSSEVRLFPAPPPGHKHRGH